MQTAAALTALERSGIFIIRGDDATAFLYGADASFQKPSPLFVVVPKDEEELIAAVRFLVEYRIPMTPRGSGTGTTGAAFPEGSVVVFTGRLTGCRIDAENHIAEVEPGVFVGDIKREAEKQGLAYPPDPASHEYATIGGTIATNAGGPTSLRYGTTRDYVRKIRFVDGTGKVHEAGATVHKYAAGYFLPALLCGSEGTLGVITRAWLRLVPLPPFSSYVEIVAPEPSDFPLIRLFAPAAMEFLDERAGELVTGARQSYLLLRLDAATDAELTAQEKRVAAKLSQLGRFYRMGRDKKEIWAVRESLSPLSYKLGERKAGLDIVLPFARIPDFLTWLARRRTTLPKGLELFTFGHLGDGNLHVNLMYPPEASVEAHLIQRDIVVQTRHLGGLISGEHGIGRARREWLPLFVEPETLALMRELKKVFDPYGLMNPGKML